MAPADIGNTPRYWIRPTQVLSAAPGFHRFVWDLHYAPPAGTSAQPGQYPISAVPHDTPREPRGPWAFRGVHGAAHRRRQDVIAASHDQDGSAREDAAGDLAQEHAMAVALFDAIARDSVTASQIRDLRAKDW